MHTRLSEWSVRVPRVLVSLGVFVGSVGEGAHSAPANLGKSAEIFPEKYLKAAEMSGLRITC